MADSVILLYIEIAVYIGFLLFYSYVDVCRIIYTCIQRIYSLTHLLTRYVPYL